MRDWAMRRWRHSRDRRILAAIGVVTLTLALMSALVALASGGIYASHTQSATGRQARLHSSTYDTLHSARALSALDASSCPTGSQLLPANKTPAMAPAMAPATRAASTTHYAQNPSRTTAPPPTISASSAFLFDPDTGQVFFSQNADQERAMASTTKIMTAVTALAFGSLSQMITIGPDAVAMQNGQDSVAGLKLGDHLTLCDLLYAMMLPSGDDAAVAIADGVAGTQARFVGEMNAEAALLGLWRTHYANPHGLDQA
ncbi:MAG TPA: serine hydrolase, partial [Ktedonobacterales bacterium]|nr:serine hydrolase [Ktedonobacterales bacterium]